MELEDHSVREVQRNIREPKPLSPKQESGGDLVAHCLEQRALSHSVLPALQLTSPHAINTVSAPTVAGSPRRRPESTAPVM